MQTADVLTMAVNYINNIVNIDAGDPIFKIVAEDTVRYAVKTFGDEELALLYKLGQRALITAGDVFLTHYLVYPLLREKNPDDVLEAARGALSKYIESQDYEKIKTLTELNDDYSRVYSVFFLSALVREMARRLPEDVKQQMLEEAQGSLDALAKGDLTPLGQGGGMSEEVAQAVAQAMSQAFKQAAKEAAEKTQTAADINSLAGNTFTKGHGGGRGGLGAGDQPGGLSQLIDLTNQVTRVAFYKEIITLAKSMKDAMPRFYNIKKQKAKRGEVDGYKLTKNVERAIPRELALDDDVFYMKLAGGGLLAREYVEVTEGAYYILIDKSGSMSGEKTAWARSVALALLSVARRRRRRFFLRFFDTSAYYLVDDRNPAELLKTILQTSSEGGTCIDCALSTALEDLRKNKLDRYTNTIIIITDGEDDVRTAPEALRRVGASLIAIMIQGDNPTLKLLAERSGGQYMTAQVTREGGLKVIAAAAR